MSEAQGGEVLVTRTVRDLVAGSGLRFDELGERSLKGLSEPITLYLAST
jgi:class 3 adenylate cyclase